MAAGEEEDDLLNTMKEKLSGRVVGSDSESEHCIFRVHNELRNVNVKAYEPEIIAIGPYHRNESHLQMMEEHKWRFLNSLLQRRNDDELRKYVDAMKALEESARRCYAEPIDLSSNEFVKMMVLDGCFIIELLRKFQMLNGPSNNGREENTIKNDPVFRMEWILSNLQRDLMLFENQLPFFVLSELYEIVSPPGAQRSRFIALAVHFFNDLFPGDGMPCEFNAFKHLLDLIHRQWSTPKLDSDAELKCNMENMEMLGSSTKLVDSGIKFMKLENEVSFDIVFKDGWLRIPVLTVEDRTECFLRNLIAHEQYCGSTYSNIVTDYTTFFGYLVKSVEDVKTLSRRGILRSFVGDDEVVCRMFSSMNNCIVGPSRNFHYAELCEKVNRHGDRYWTMSMAFLRRKYMNCFWGILSILAASTLLLLSLLQVIYQIKSYNNGK